MFAYIFDLLKERSTWVGLLGIATAGGAIFSPELAASIISAGVAFGSLFAIFMRDKK